MKQILILSSLALALLLSSCTSSLNTFADYDKNADLNKYKTYAWLSPGDSLDANPQNHQFELMYSKAITLMLKKRV